MKSLMEGLPGSEDSERAYLLVEVFLKQGILVLVDGVLFNVAIELTAGQSYPTPGFSAFINDLIDLDTKSSEDTVTIKLQSPRLTPIAADTDLPCQPH
jgi:hypothetical protein